MIFGWKWVSSGKYAGDQTRSSSYENIATKAISSSNEIRMETRGIKVVKMIPKAFLKCNHNSHVMENEQVKNYRMWFCVPRDLITRIPIGSRQGTYWWHKVVFTGSASHFLWFGWCRRLCGAGDGVPGRSPLSTPFNPFQPLSTFHLATFHHPKHLKLLSLTSLDRSNVSWLLSFSL